MVTDAIRILRPVATAMAVAFALNQSDPDLSYTVHIVPVASKVLAYIEVRDAKTLRLIGTL